MKKYSCSLDKIARTAPWFVSVLAITGIGKLTYSTYVSHQHITLMALFISVLLLPGILIAMYLLKPLSVTISETDITIDRKIMPVVITFADTSTIKEVPDMSFAIRTMGNGGIFGYTGKYYKKDIGSMTWYCTQRKNYILIEKTDGKKIVITPDDAAGFMQEVKMRWPHLVTM